jgi:hypothetical protein
MLGLSKVVANAWQVTPCREGGRISAYRRRCRGRERARLGGAVVAFRHWRRPLPLSLLASEFAGASNGLSSLADPPFRGLLISAPLLHLPKDAFPLHLLFQHAKGLFDIIVTD